MSRLLLFIFCILLISCSSDPIIVREYYEKTGTIKTEHRYYSKDKKNFEYRSYYPSGRIKSEGSMVDSLREGIWKYWNEYREEMVAYYKKGKIDFNHQDRIFPKIILEESLEIGKYTPFRVSNLYLGESISVSNNAFMNHNIKGQLYVTPLSGNYVTFYFDSSDEINFDDDCKIILSKKIGASEEEFLSADYYSVHKIKIASCRITK